jgi:transcriptional regulator with XRE-family HTH domain
LIGKGVRALILIRSPREIGARIVQIRGKTTQEEFAESLGVHKQTLGRYERGERIPDGDFISKLCRRYKVYMPWLMYGQFPEDTSFATYDWPRRTRKAPVAREEATTYYVPAEGDFVFVPRYDVRARWSPRCDRATWC